MKILHTIDSLDPDRGGPPAVVLQLAAAQSHSADDTAILTYDFTPTEADRIRKYIEDLPGSERIRFLYAPRTKRVETLTGKSIGSFAREVLDEYDFVHLHGIWTSSSHAVAARCRETQTPYAICIHGMLDDWCMRQSVLKKKLSLAIRTRRALQSAAFIHALNDHERGVIERFGFHSPIEVIPNGVFVEEFDPPPATGVFHAAHSELNGEPYVLFLSRLHHKKGLDLLAPSFADALAAAPQLRLVVAGPDGGAEAGFRQDVASLGLENRVHLTGPLYGAEKYRALAGAAVFCLPSRQEGFSIAVTEALASAVPCVVSDQCHYPEVAEADAGRVVPLEPARIGAAISEVLADENDRIAMGQRGRDLVFDRFTWPKIAQQTLGIYAAHATGGDSSQ